MERFEVDGVVIKTPSEYKPVFAVTSTDDSARTMDGVMHNTPMFTVAGYDLKWEWMSWNEISTILHAMVGKPSFSFKHKDPMQPGGWVTAEFYASNFSMDAQTLEEDEETWTGLSINVRSIGTV